MHRHILFVCAVRVPLDYIRCMAWIFFGGESANGLRDSCTDASSYPSTSVAGGHKGGESGCMKWTEGQIERERGKEGDPGLTGRQGVAWLGDVSRPMARVRGTYPKGGRCGDNLM